jgi:DNA polymerase III alpha subunit
MKARHPALFACGVLNYYGGAYPLRTVAADFARGGVRILRPDVNLSHDEHVIEKDAVRLGLGAVKHVTKKTVRAIFAQRPFVDMRDFFERVAPRRQELRALVLSGACDDLAPLSARGYPIAHEELLAAGTLDGFVAHAPAGPNADAYRALVRIRNEVTFTDMHPSDHPMRVLRDEASAAGATPIASLREGEGRIAGIVAASRRIETQGKRKMQFVTIEDETGVIEVVLTPGVYAALGDPVTNAGPFLIDGMFQDDALTAKSVIPFHRRPSPWRRSA